MTMLKNIYGEPIHCNLKGLIQTAPITETRRTERAVLVECVDFRYNLCESADEAEKRFIVKGILQRAGAKNHNGRVYPKDVLMREVQKYVENFINENRALGECDHPESPIVSLKNASHKVLEVHWEGDDLVGTLEVLPTPSGEILKTLFRNRVNIGISSRGLGTVTKNESTGADVVENDFELIAFDFVSNPSTRGAFMYPAGGRSLNECVQPLMSLNENVQRSKPIITWEGAYNLYRKEYAYLLKSAFMSEKQILNEFKTAHHFS